MGQEDLVTSIVIPDAIEPVVGWKGMTLLRDGRLMSPTVSVVWPVRQPFKAECLATQRGIWEWQSHYSDSDVGLSVEAANVGSPVLLLPPGMEWRYVWISDMHDIPTSDCSCGVYIVQDQNYALNYGLTLVEVAGWGTTVVADKGWRAAYAYPKRIVVSTEEERAVVADYGVPVLLRSELEKTARIPRQSKDVARGLLCMRIALALLLGIASFQTGMFIVEQDVFTSIAMTLCWCIFAVALAVSIITDQLTKRE